jgi:hypothetical protein
MKALLNDLWGRKREQHVNVQFDAWFKALASVLHHISHLSPSLNFDSFCRHATDAICHGLAPLSPVAAHFHIDVCTSHLWLPDSSFKLDSFFRMQNRILMSSQTRPVETSREELHKTICYIPYELHKQAIEVVVYHTEDSRTQQGIIAPVLEGYTRAITQALTLREDHLIKKVEWESQVEKILGSRLSEAIHQVGSPFLYAQSLRAFHLPSVLDGKEHVFLNNVPHQDIFRSAIIRHNSKGKNERSSLRSIAFVSSLAAQLRLFENNAQQSSFSDFTQHFAQSLNSLSHLLTMQDEVHFILFEFSQKNGVAKWHNAGFPPPVLFGKAADTLSLPSVAALKVFTINDSHDWQLQQSITLPIGAGLVFFTEGVLKRLSEIHLTSGSFFERLRPSTNAAQLVIEAEKILSMPDASRVVSASVTDWNKLHYDLTLLSAFNNGIKSINDH